MGNETGAGTDVARKSPGKMTTWIGRWGGSLEQGNLKFEVLAVLTDDTPKARREALLKLGEGDYDTVTGRRGDVSYHKKTSDSFAV